MFVLCQVAHAAHSLHITQKRLFYAAEKEMRQWDGQHSCWRLLRPALSGSHSQTGLLDSVSGPYTHEHEWASLNTYNFLCPWRSPGNNTGVGCHFLLWGDLPDPGIEPVSLASPALAGGFFTTCAT